MTSIAARLSSKPSHMASTPRRKLFVRHPELFTIILIVLVGAVVGTINPYFFQLSTVFDILRSSTVTGLFALGVLIVLAAGASTFHLPRSPRCACMRSPKPSWVTGRRHHSR